LVAAPRGRRGAAEALGQAARERADGGATAPSCRDPPRASRAAPPPARSPLRGLPRAFRGGLCDARPRGGFPPSLRPALSSRVLDDPRREDGRADGEELVGVAAMNDRSPMATAFEVGDQREVPYAERQRRAELRAILKRHGGVREVVVFPTSIGWELPFLFQRPQQMARALARRGCLVFYCEPDSPNRHPEGFDPIDERLYTANVEPQIFDEIESPVAVVFIYSWEHVRFLKRPRIVYEHLDSLDLLGATPARV